MLFSDTGKFLVVKVVRGKGRTSEEYAHADLTVRYGFLLKQAGEHPVVEGDLQAVLHLGFGGAFHIGYEEVQGAVLVALHTEDIYIAPEPPLA